MSSPSAPSSKLREQVAGCNVKGGIVKAHIDWIRATHGEAGITSVLSKLSKETAAEVARAFPTAWFPLGTLLEFDRAIQSAFGGHGDFFREIGRYSAQQNLSTTYRLYKRGDIHEFFERSALLHAQFQDFGTARYEKVGPNHCRIVHEARGFSPTWCASAIGYYEQVIVIHGGKPLSVSESSCQCRGDASCVFELRWA